MENNPRFVRVVKNMQEEINELREQVRILQKTVTVLCEENEELETLVDSLAMWG